MNRYNSDSYDAFEALFDPMHTDRKARRKRKPRVKHVPKKDQREVIEEIADAEGLEAGFQTTYNPGLFEEGWLLQSLRTYYDQHIITDVLGRVKGGKEASVYRCEGHPSTELPMIAAKVYRPRMFRNLRNDAMYRQGREILKSNGKVVKNNDHRVMRAVGKKSAFGEEVAHTSWLMYEYTTLQKLYDAGAAVPQPVSSSENTILMGYYGDEKMGAPTLNEVRLDKDEAVPLFHEVLRNIELMLQHGIIHGDLSAYNILYWEGNIVLIDFPQVVNPHSNSDARAIFYRDVTRICDYFAGQGVRCDAEQTARRLWKRYAEPDARDRAADLSRLEVDDEE